MLGVVIDPRRPAEVIRSKRVPTPSGPDALLDGIEELTEALAVSESATVGVGIPGLIDREDRFRAGPNLPGVIDLPVGADLRARLGRRVVADNDATCATAAEFSAGAGVGHDDGVLLTIGTGIGGGIVMDGKVRHGANGFAGEFGHIMLDPAGPLCPCGRRGCFERYASGSGLGRIARDAAIAGKLSAVVTRAGGDVEAVRGEHVVAAARGGDTDAGAVLDEFAWWLAAGIADMITVFDPSIVVLGGGVMEAGDLILHRVQARVPGQVMAARHRPEVTVAEAKLGEEAGAIGAAILACS